MKTNKTTKTVGNTMKRRWKNKEGRERKGGRKFEKEST